MSFSSHQLTYLDPNEVRSWQPPTPASSKRVEMDRTVMPCGTVVTTITAVKSKPGRPHPLNIGTALKNLRLTQLEHKKFSPFQPLIISCCRIFNIDNGKQFHQDVRAVIKSVLMDGYGLSAGRNLYEARRWSTQNIKVVDHSVSP